MEFQLSTEQFEELKKSILADLKEDRKNFPAYLIGRKLVKDVPVEERDELCDVAEELCQRIVEARKAKQ